MVVSSCCCFLFVILGGWRSGQSHQTVNLAPSGYGGSNPSPPTLYCRDSSAVEHFHGKEGVPGSSPGLGSENNNNMTTKSKKKAYVKLQCAACKRINYSVKKSKGEDVEKKLELSKFCSWCRSHKPHKEIKK